MLTRKQKDLLTMIRDRMAQDGVPPSFDEMREQLGLRSKSGIHRLITGLEERGFIRRMPHRARALEIVRLPETMATRSARRGGRVATATPAAMPSTSTGGISLPLLGRIAAGTPIEALSDPSSFLDVPVGLLAGGGKGEHFALEVSGDSMIEAGILDGDRVIIRRADRADDGAIVVALVDGHEATLKTLRRQAGQIALEPANARYQTRILPAERVRVQGLLVGLMRRY